MAHQNFSNWKLERLLVHMDAIKAIIKLIFLEYDENIYMIHKNY